MIEDAKVNLIKEPPNTIHSFYDFLFKFHTIEEQTKIEILLRKAEKIPIDELSEVHNINYLMVLLFYRRLSMISSINLMSVEINFILEIFKSFQIYGSEENTANERIEQLKSGIVTSKIDRETEQLSESASLISAVGEILSFEGKKL